MIITFDILDMVCRSTATNVKKQKSLVPILKNGNFLIINFASWIFIFFFVKNYNIFFKQLMLRIQKKTIEEDKRRK